MVIPMSSPNLIKFHGVMSLKVTRDQYILIKKAAEDDRRSMSSFIRLAVFDKIDQMKIRKRPRLDD